MSTSNPACVSDNSNRINPFDTQLSIKLVGIEKDDHSVIISITLTVKSDVDGDSVRTTAASLPKSAESDAGIEYHLRNGTVRVRTIPFLCEGDN